MATSDKMAESHSRRFPTTSWTMVSAARRHSSGSADALSKLCATYWLPVYAFIRRKGYSREESEDLCQAFLTGLSTTARWAKPGGNAASSAPSYWRR